MKSCIVPAGLDACDYKSCRTRTTEKTLTISIASVASSPRPRASADTCKGLTAFSEVLEEWGAFRRRVAPQWHPKKDRATPRRNCRGDAGRLRLGRRRPQARSPLTADRAEWRAPRSRLQIPPPGEKRHIRRYSTAGAAAFPAAMVIPVTRMKSANVPTPRKPSPDAPELRVDIIVMTLPSTAKKASHIV